MAGLTEVPAKLANPIRKNADALDAYGLGIVAWRNDPGEGLGEGGASREGGVIYLSVEATISDTMKYKLATRAVLPPPTTLKIRPTKMSYMGMTLSKPRTLNSYSKESMESVIATRIIGLQPILYIGLYYVYLG